MRHHRRVDAERLEYLLRGRLDAPQTACPEIGKFEKLDVVRVDVPDRSDVQDKRPLALLRVAGDDRQGRVVIGIRHLVGRVVRLVLHRQHGFDDALALKYPGDLFDRLRQQRAAVVPMRVALGAELRAVGTEPDPAQAALAIILVELAFVVKRDLVPDLPDDDLAALGVNADRLGEFFFGV